MKFFNWIFSTFFAVLVVVFAVSNMQEAELFYSPLHNPISLPVSVIALVALGAGFFCGGFFVWCVHGPLSRKADKKRAQVYGLLKENDKLKEEKATFETANSSTHLLGSK